MDKLLYALWFFLSSFVGVRPHSTTPPIAKVVTSPTATATPLFIPTHAFTPTPTNSPSHPPIQSAHPTGKQIQGLSSVSSIPAGATAKCTDGTYSFSQHRSGTCSQ